MCSETRREPPTLIQTNETTMTTAVNFLLFLSLVSFASPFVFLGRLAKTYSSSRYQLETVADTPTSGERDQKPRIVLVAGFESFNRELYENAAKEAGVELTVFADSDIRTDPTSVNNEDLGVNPAFAEAMDEADAFIGSLVFDYDDVLVVQKYAEKITGPRFVFECATEIMTLNKVGSFSMNQKAGASGPPAPVKKVLSMFSSGKEEDKISGYLKFLKIGPTLLQYVPGEKAGDLRVWLETYRYWNQGGMQNVKSMLQLVSDTCKNKEDQETLILPDLQVTPDIGLIHPLREGMGYWESPASFLDWRLSKTTYTTAEEQKFKLAPPGAPRVAVLLYRKHVITEQRYLYDLITMMENQGVIPVPIFINGVEAHTIVRDLLTSEHEIKAIQKGECSRDATYQPNKAVTVDAIVNTIGFPLVGGPAGSIEAGRNLHVSSKLLGDMNVPYM
jgi:magnesium chelatase subunit H